MGHVGQVTRGGVGHLRQPDDSGAYPRSACQSAPARTVFLEAARLLERCGWCRHAFRCGPARDLATALVDAAGRGFW